MLQVCNGVRDCPGGGDETPLPEMTDAQPVSVAYAHNWSIVHEEKACLRTERTDSTSVLLPVIILVFLATLLLAFYLVRKDISLQNR